MSKDFKLQSLVLGVLWRASMERKQTMYLKNFWQLGVGVLLSLMALCWVAYGATYNFYFNNTEQGPNSTANPHVSVSDGNVSGAESKSLMGPEKAEAAPPAVTPLPSAAPAPVEAPAPAAASVAVIPATEPVVSHPERHLRILLGGGFVAPKETIDVAYSDYISYGDYTYRAHKFYAGAKFEVGLFPNRDAGLNFFGGGFGNGGGEARGFGGAELELQPVHVSIGRAYELINFGLMLGATTLGRVDDNWVAAHAGARLQFNIGDRWGFAATGRANLGFYAADGSLVVRM